MQEGSQEDEAATVTKVCLLIISLIYNHFFTEALAAFLEGRTFTRFFEA